MKRKLLAILFIFATCVLPAVAIEKVKIGDLYYNLNPDDRTAEVTLANNDIISLNIPATVEYNSTTFHVTGIRDYAFQGSNSLTFVSIPNSITHITGSAFLGCNNLKTPVYNAHKFVYLPRSYKGAYTIPEGIKTIAQDAFLSCKKLTSVTIPSTVRSIENKAFFNCVCLASVIIPNGVTDIEDFAFYGCITLNSVTIPNSVTNVGKDIFGCCDKLEKPIYNTRCFVSLPRSYKGVYKIPTGIESIAPFAFGGCSNLPSVKIPNSVTSIGESAFVGCSNLKEIHYPQGLDLSQAVIPSSTKLIAYDPTNSSTNATTTASSGSTSATNSVTSSRTAATQPSTPTTKPISTTPTIPAKLPECRIDYSKPENIYHSSSIRLCYSVDSELSDNQEIEFLIDGTPVEPKTLSQQKGVRPVQCTEVELDNMPTIANHVTKVSIRIVDKSLRMSWSEKSIVLRYQSIHKPTLHVFAVGVNKYKAEGFTKLDYAEQDAKDFTDVIMEMADKNMYKKVDTTLILGSAATTFNLQERLTQLSNQVEPNDVVMIFFSGHGLKENKKSYFISSDAIRPYQGLDMEFIRNRADEMECPVFVFMDACHSGPSNDKTKGVIEPIIVADKGVIGFYSCKSGQQSIEKKEYKNGVFTYVLVRGLKGAADVDEDGYISISDLENYVKKQVPSLSERKQTPVVLNSEVGDAILFRIKKK